MPSETETQLLRSGVWPGNRVAIGPGQVPPPATTEAVNVEVAIGLVCSDTAAPVQEPPGPHPSAAGPTQPVQEPPPPATTEAGADSPDWSPVSGLVECESLEVLTNPTLPDPTAEWEQ